MGKMKVSKIFTFMKYLVEEQIPSMSCPAVLCKRKSLPRRSYSCGYIYKLLPALVLNHSSHYEILTVSPEILLKDQTLK